MEDYNKNMEEGKINKVQDSGKIKTMTDVKNGASGSGKVTANDGDLTPVEVEKVIDEVATKKVKFVFDDAKGTDKSETVSDLNKV